MNDDFSAVMERVRHNQDFEGWSVEDLIRELCEPKSATKLIEQMETNRGRFRTQPIKGMLTEVTTPDEDFRGVWFSDLPEFASLLLGEKAKPFAQWLKDPENLRQINDERARVRRERSALAEMLLGPIDLEEMAEEAAWRNRKR